MADVIVCPDAGKVRIVQNWLGGGFAPGDSLVLHLATNLPTIGDATVTGDFTEPTGGWYAPHAALVNSNTLIGITAGLAQVKYNGAPVAFASTGPAETIFGWFLVEQSTGICLLACQYDTFVVLVAGATHTVDITFGAHLCTG